MESRRIFYMLDLQKTRKEIDRIDQEIVKLFEARMELTQEVADFKIKTGKKVFDKEREEEKLDSLSAMTDNPFNKRGIKELFSQIMSISRKRQYELLSDRHGQIDFYKIEEKELEKRKIACFGARGSYAEQAMEEYFGAEQEIEPAYYPTFKGVMEAVHQGRAEFGVLPIENTSTGGITDIYDLLVKYENYIIGEHVVKVEQALLGLPGSRIEDLKIVYSHMQGIMQCAKFLEEHENMKAVDSGSTAGGAKRVAEDKDNTQAAIASTRAATYYGLEVLQPNINHENKNYTRFIIITNKKIYLEKANKISICFEIPHESGSLYSLLSHFIYNDLNMTKIESRPIGGKNWEYRFFVEFEGNLKESGVKNALHSIMEEAQSLKILGNF